VGLISFTRTQANTLMMTRHGRARESYGVDSPYLLIVPETTSQQHLPHAYVVILKQLFINHPRSKPLITCLACLASWSGILVST
jgi:hypothetical protein